jgi:serine/threonine-protein kinase
MAIAGPELMWDADHGRRVGEYDLLRIASTGGTCSVWVARHRELGSYVAVKLLNERTQSPELRERLIQEAQLCARVQHPNVVRVHEFGFTEWDAPYVVMELLDGCNLRDEIEERGSFTPRAAVRLLMPLLDGLAFAHDRNVVHRDLKPENVFLDHSSGDVVPKLVDFGIARCLEDENGRRITDAGSVFGTVRYLSPEQAVGADDVDHRADIWGFCMLMYECITDSAPFGNEDTGEVLRAIIQTDAPPLSAHGVDDEGLWSILALGLRRNRAERWPDAKSLRMALQSWLAVHPSREREDLESGRRVLKRALAVPGAPRLSAREREAVTGAPVVRLSTSEREAVTVVSGGRRR